MMRIKLPTLLILLILVSGLTFIITFIVVGFRVHIQTRKDANIIEITYLLRIAEPLHTGDYDEAKRALCDLLLIHAVNVGKLKRSRVFGEREAANQSIARIGSFYESNGGYLDTYFVVDALRYIEEARMELNE